MRLKVLLVAIAAPTARALAQAQDDFLVRRNADFGRPGYDLRKVMAERLQRLLEIERGE